MSWGRWRGGTARATARPGEQPDSEEGAKARREGIEGIERAGLPCVSVGNRISGIASLQASEQANLRACRAASCCCRSFSEGSEMQSRIESREEEKKRDIHRDSLEALVT